MLKALFYPDVPFHSLAFEWIFKEIWLDQVYEDVVKDGKTDKIMIDIGCNIGLVTHYLRDFCSKIYCIEPSSEHFEALSINKEYNYWDNVSLYNIAITGKDGEVTLRKNSSNRTMNSIAFANTGGEEQKVEGQTLETFFKQNNITHVDFCKLDVEGAEFDIMTSDGFKNVIDKVDMIEIEFHDDKWVELNDLMLGFGFKSKVFEVGAKVILYYR
jgi:FkbM family methyltransferase